MNQFIGEEMTMLLLVLMTAATMWAMFKYGAKFVLGLILVILLLAAVGAAAGDVQNGVIIVGY